MLEDLFSLFIRHKWSLKSLEDVAKFVNSIPGSNIRLPTTKYSLLQDYWRYSCISPFQYYFCVTCKTYTKKDFSKKKDRKCEHCKQQCGKDNFFIIFGLKDQIKAVLQKYFNEIIEYRETVMKQNEITDMYNSNYLKTKLNLNDNIWSMSLNTDGVSIVQSNKASLWPILLMCNFLPPHLRFKDNNIILAGLFYGFDKPNMHDFFEPIVREFMDLSSNGIFVNDRIFKIFITNALLDLPAKSVLLQMKQFNSWHACNFCTQKGEKTNRGIRYTYECPVILRTHRTMLRDMDKVQKNPNSTFNGIKGVSPMVPFENFDLATSFCIDYMHAILLGVMKNLMLFWTDTKNKTAPFYMVKQKRDLLNIRLTAIKTPMYISRRPRSLNNLKYFKASEYRNLLLFYLPVCLKRLLPKKYIEHLRIFSSAIYKLLQPKISKDDLDIVQEQLHDFVGKYQIFYGKASMTMNVHSLLHLVDCVRNFGPLYCFSMFPFEAYNSRLKDFVVAPVDVLHQITTRYIGYNWLHQSKSDESTEAITLKSEIYVTLESYHLDALERADIAGNITCFACAIHNAVRFTSRFYQKAKKTADFFVDTEEGIGVVEFYFYNNSKYYAMMESLEVYKTVGQIRKVFFTNKYTIIEVKQIKERCIHMNLLGKNYIVARPNRFERN